MRVKSCSDINCPSMIHVKVCDGLFMSIRNLKAKTVTKPVGTSVHLMAW